MIEKKRLEQGFIDEPTPGGTDVKTEVRRMCKEKNVLIITHYYTEGVIQELADFIGDSLALAQEVVTADAGIIAICGVHFMGETNKILRPKKTIFVPGLNAFCSPAEDCPTGEFEKSIKTHSDRTAVSCVDTTVAIRTMIDVVVTSNNAKQIVESLPKGTLIVFGPGRSLGRYISEQARYEMLLWGSACEVHDRFPVEKIQQLKCEHPTARVLTHPECPSAVFCLADRVESTPTLLKYSVEGDTQELIVVTEGSILAEIQRLVPQETFIPAPPNDSDNPRSGYEYIKYVTLRKLYNCLKYERSAIEAEPEMAKRAIKSIHRMLDISNRLDL